ncbi:uncharacterized protein LOC110274165 [Arachis duranensis]|uniref:Uncharacterized protein LOC110274165 n=1 Tax=Arachis duranensis TaxID=130453 RepID=A0A6P5MEJ8_ARADU|nr:uncharacterized protein LOC110274165 [Arachis duranensis]XP_052108176.1 uncharacterized protein LOC110274165 [Arachis duranensis]
MFLPSPVHTLPLCSLPQRCRWKRRARQFCLSLPPPSELPPSPPELQVEFLPRDPAAVAGKVCRHRCRSRVATAAGGGCWGYHPTSSEAVVVRFRRSFLVSELESGLLVPFGDVSAFERAGRAEILIVGDFGSR